MVTFHLFPCSLNQAHNTDSQQRRTLTVLLLAVSGPFGGLSIILSYSTCKFVVILVLSIILTVQISLRLPASLIHSLQLSSFRESYLVHNTSYLLVKH